MALLLLKLADPWFRHTCAPLKMCLQPSNTWLSKNLQHSYKSTLVYVTKALTTWLQDFFVFHRGNCAAVTTAIALLLTFLTVYSQLWLNLSTMSLCVYVAPRVWAPILYWALLEIIPLMLRLFYQLQWALIMKRMPAQWSSMSKKGRRAYVKKKKKIHRSFLFCASIVLRSPQRMRVNKSFAKKENKQSLHILSAHKDCFFIIIIHLFIFYQLLSKDMYMGVWVPILPIWKITRKVFASDRLLHLSQLQMQSRSK